MLKPLMHFVLEDELKAHPEKHPILGTLMPSKSSVQKEKRAAELGQELLETLWHTPNKKPKTFWGKVTFALSDGVDLDLPLKMFNQITAFRKDHNLSKEEMKKVMSYLGRAFNEGTEMLYAACWLFHYKPQIFKKYATNSDDFKYDVREGSFKEENVPYPLLAMPLGIWWVANGEIAEKKDAEHRRLPLRSFGPIKCGYHPSLSNSFREIQSYRQMLQEPAWTALPRNSYRNIQFNKILYYLYPQSNYPSNRHQSVIIAAKEFIKRLNNEKTATGPTPRNLPQGPSSRH